MLVNKKNIISFLSIAILLLVLLGLYFIKENSTINNYKRQSIVVLKQYKNGKLTREETKEKINSISDKLDREYENKDETKLLMLNITLGNIEWELVKSELSDTEISNYIGEIKNK